MKLMEFKSYSEFADQIIETYEALEEHQEFPIVSIVAKYEEMRQIIKELVFHYELGNISLYDPDTCGYEDEYYCTLMREDNDVYIACEEFKRDNGYFDGCSDIAFVVNTSSSKCLNHIEDRVIVEVQMSDDAVSNTDNASMETIYVSKDSNGIPTGFSKTWYAVDNGTEATCTYSHYTSDTEMLRKIAENYGVIL